MSLSDLERAGRLRRHETSPQEVADLMRIADEGLADARVEAVTVDRRFCAAYDATRALADLVLACTGYRPAGQGRHVTVFEALPFVLGEDYGDADRRHLPGAAQVTSGLALLLAALRTQR